MPTWVFAPSGATNTRGWYKLFPKEQMDNLQISQYMKMYSGIGRDSIKTPYISGFTIFPLFCSIFSQEYVICFYICAVTEDNG